MRTAKQNSLETKKVANPETKQYKSVEEKLLDNVIKPVASYLSDFGQGFYSGVVSYFRITTSNRKIMNEQTYIQKEKFSLKKIKHSGTSLFGLCVGIGTDVYLHAATLASYLNPEANQQFKNLLYAWLATNICSACYEIGRKKETKAEYQIIKQAKSAKKAKQKAEADSKKTKTGGKN